MSSLSISIEEIVSGIVASIEEAASNPSRIADVVRIDTFLDWLQSFLLRNGCSSTSSTSCDILQSESGPLDVLVRTCNEVPPVQTSEECSIIVKLASRLKKPVSKLLLSCEGDDCPIPQHHTTAGFKMKSFKEVFIDTGDCCEANQASTYYLGAGVASVLLSFPQHCIADRLGLEFNTIWRDCIESYDASHKYAALKLLKKLIRGGLQKEQSHSLAEIAQLFAHESTHIASAAGDVFVALISKLGWTTDENVNATLQGLCSHTSNFDAESCTISTILALVKHGVDGAACVSTRQHVRNELVSLGAMKIVLKSLSSKDRIVQNQALEITRLVSANTSGSDRIGDVQCCWRTLLDMQSPYDFLVLTLESIVNQNQPQWSSLVIETAASFIFWQDELPADAPKWWNCQLMELIELPIKYSNTNTDQAAASPELSPQSEITSDCDTPISKRQKVNYSTNCNHKDFEAVKMDLQRLLKLERYRIAMIKSAVSCLERKIYRKQNRLANCDLLCTAIEQTMELNQQIAQAAISGIIGIFKTENDSLEVPSHIIERILNALIKVAERPITASTSFRDQRSIIVVLKAIAVVVQICGHHDVPETALNSISTMLLRRMFDSRWEVRDATVTMASTVLCSTKISQKNKLLIVSPRLITTIWASRSEEASFVQAESFVFVRKTIEKIPVQSDISNHVLQHCGGIKSIQEAVVNGLKHDEASVRRAALSVCGAVVQVSSQSMNENSCINWRDLSAQFLEAIAAIRSDADWEMKVELVRVIGYSLKPDFGQVNRLKLDPFFQLYGDDIIRELSEDLDRISRLAAIQVLQKFQQMVNNDFEFDKPRFSDRFLRFSEFLKSNNFKKLERIAMDEKPMVLQPWKEIFLEEIPSGLSVEDARFELDCY